MPIASVHPMVVGRSDALHWCKTERLWRSSEERIEAPVEPTVSSQASVQSTYCSRDVVKRTATKPSAPDEPMPHRSKRRCNDVSKEQRLSADQVSPEEPTPKASVQPMVPKGAAAVSEKPTASSERRVTGRTDALAPEVPMPMQKYAQRL